MDEAMPTTSNGVIISDQLEFSPPLTRFQTGREIAHLMAMVTHRFCVSILAKQPGRPICHCATGTLFQVADRYFLISAGHVVDDANVGCASLLLQNGVPGSDAIPLVSRPLYTRIGRDPFDLAIWPLDGPIISELQQSKEFVNQSCIDWYSDMHNVPLDEIFYLCGFPSDLAELDPNDEHHIYLEPVRWVAEQCPDPNRHPEGVDRRFHLVLDDTTAVKLDSNGNEATPPRVPNGISGCGIWTVSATRMRNGTWKPESPRLVAIQTCVYSESSIVRGTGWVGIRSILSKAFPDVARSFDLILR